MQIPAHIQELIDQGALFVINHSGGKDSQAMTALLADVIPAKQALIVHAELPEADWHGIPEHIQATRPQGWRMKFVSAIHKDGTDKTFFSMVERRFETTEGKKPCFPSKKARTCTSDLKRGPIEKEVKAYLKRQPQFKGVAVFVGGERAEESSDREKLETFEPRTRMNQAGRDCYDWRPIHGLTTEEVFAVIEDAGQEPHEVYGLGMSRLSCCFCIFGSKRDLSTAAKLKPELYARYVELEQRTGYTLSMSGKPLTEMTGIAVQITEQKELF